MIRLHSSAIVLLSSALFLVLITHSVATQAFGFKAHRVIGLIADQNLSANAKAQISQILEGESLARASTWADEMRSAKDNPEFWGYDYSANWHFVNIGQGLSYENSDISPQGDAYTAVLTFIAILQDAPIPDGPVRNGLAFYFGDLQEHRSEVKQFALRFLIHLVGDLHQPMHVGFKEDQGGNTIQVRWFTKRTNLHTVWDSRLVEHQGLSVTALNTKLTSNISSLTNTSIIEIQAATPLEWVNQSLILRDSAYDIEPYQASLAEDYSAQFVPVVEQQMIKAGLRLAALLNLIL